MNTATRKENVSYAAVVRSDVNTANIIDFIDTECQKYFHMDFFELKRKMEEFLPVYTKLPAEKRPLALINLTLSISK